MSDLSQLQVKSVRGRVSNEEWQARVDLAACYRLVHHYGMDDLVYNHISARVPGKEGHFLINAYGMTYDEITASSLVKIDFDGKVVGGLLPLTQNAMFFSGVGTHDYEGPAVELDEQKRLVTDLGGHVAMILRNHGLLAVGATIPEAFITIYWLERACQAQVFAMNTKLRMPEQNTIKTTNDRYKPGQRRRIGELEWAGLLRLLERRYPGFRD